MEFLTDEAIAGFDEVGHTMEFPRALGFGGAEDRQSSDVFARAVLGSLLAQMADLAACDDHANELRRIALGEAEYVAAAKLRDSVGGWSYFPDLPDLPYDADSLGAALELFTRAAPQFVPLCELPLQLALASQDAGGSISTWIIPETDAAERRTRMREGVARFWGEDRSVDVCARLFGALNMRDRDRSAVDAGVRHVLAAQEATGTWSGNWYWGPYYVTALCSDLLRQRADGATAMARAQAYMVRTQREEGGWGEKLSTPQDTAWALWVLRDAKDAAAEAASRRGLDWLCAQQKSAGHWQAARWIRMDVGRAHGKVLHTLSYHSLTLSTAFCLRSAMYFAAQH